MKCLLLFTILVQLINSQAFFIKHYRFPTHERIIPLLKRDSSNDELHTIVYETDQELTRLVTEKLTIHDKNDLCFKSESCAMGWMENYNYMLQKVLQKVSYLEFTYSTNMTVDNEELKNQNALVSNKFQQITKQIASKFLKNYGSWNEDLKRMIFFVAQGTSFSDLRDVKTYSILSNKLESIYATATVCHSENATCLSLEPDLTKLMANSRNYDELLWAWRGWHEATGPKMRHIYARTVQLQNKAALENGYNDLSQFWIGDFEAQNFEKDIENLLSQIKPLYDQIHEYVRNKLEKVYGDKYPEDHDPKLIPAHLLGNMWAQRWENIYDLVMPYPEAEEIDLTSSLIAKNFTVKKMFEESERFFTSLGLPKMTPEFWANSMFEKPKDRNVMCHASAHDLFNGFDFRIKMCTVVDDDTFVVIHHEMGHIQYYMAYSDQPSIFKAGANSAFHEAIGDTIALSVLTPGHFKKIGLISDDSMTKEQEINYLMKMALRKVVFLPFGFLMDKWRWDVFRGKINQSNYNKVWWEMRKKYQGIEPPIARSENDFDPGAKYHIPSYVPYARYFISHFLQFQFYEALCNHAGYEGQELHKCDFYDSKKAGEYLEKMLKLGCSKHWSHALQVIANQTEVSAEPILKYFKPLEEWLKVENAKYSQQKNLTSTSSI